MHAVDGFVLEKKLVVLGYGDEEKDCGYILEAVDPLLPLGSLSTNIEHPVGELADDEGGFCYAGGLDTGSEHILIIREVVRL